jgi:hypothetical protein
VNELGDGTEGNLEGHRRIREGIWVDRGVKMWSWEGQVRDDGILKYEGTNEGKRRAIVIDGWTSWRLKETF